MPIDLFHFGRHCVNSSNICVHSIQLQRKGIIVDSLLDDGEVNVKDLLMKGVTPFPYKVAKSLDPNIYRNVEFDVWIDFRRGKKAIL